MSRQGRARLGAKGGELDLAQVAACVKGDGAPAWGACTSQSPITRAGSLRLTLRTQAHLHQASVEVQVLEPARTGRQGPSHSCTVVGSGGCGRCLRMSNVSMSLEHHPWVRSMRCDVMCHFPADRRRPHTPARQSQAQPSTRAARRAARGAHRSSRTAAPGTGSRRSPAQRQLHPTLRLQLRPARCPAAAPAR